MKTLRNLLASAMLTVQKALSPDPDRVHPWEATEETEREEERDEWQRMMHHDDVTPQEQAMLYSDDPEQIKQAQEQIFQRQAEFQAWWDDKQKRNKAFYGIWHDEIEKGVKPVPITDHEGWADDEDMPEYYETVVRVNGSDEGKAVKVPFELGEKLAEMLGPDDEQDEQFNWMFDWLVELYNEKGNLYQHDYDLALYAWETKLHA